MFRARWCCHRFPAKSAFCVSNLLWPSIFLCIRLTFQTKNSSIILTGLFSNTSIKCKILEMGQMWSKSYAKISIQAGIEPAIFCSVGRRVIHCATGPLIFIFKYLMLLLQVFVIKFRQSFYSYNPSLPSAWPLLGDRQMLTGPSPQSFFVLPFEIPTATQHLSKKSLSFSKRFLF